MSPVLASALGTLAGIGLFVAGLAGLAILEPWIGVGGQAIGFVLLLGAAIAGFIGLIFWSERAERQRVEREGTRCRALVKSYRRVSMTQHRVLFLIDFPGGQAGREYLLSGLSDAWLADVCARGLPITVLAHPEASTVIVAS